MSAVSVGEEASASRFPAAPGPDRTGPWLGAARAACAVALALAVGFGIFIGALSSLPQGRAQAGLERRFASELAVGAAPVNQPVASGAPVALLEIPAIGVRQVVVEGTRPAQLTSGPGHLPVSALPGQEGVGIVFGRRTAYGGPFADLGRLGRGAEIRSTTGQGTVRYRVVRVRTASAADGNALTAAGNALLLVTSDPVGRATRRLIVEARPVGTVEAAGRPATTGVTAADLGLSGDTGALPALLVALELLVLVIAAVLLVRRRLGGTVAWLLGLPLLLAGTWLVFEQAALLLPATL